MKAATVYSRGNEVFVHASSKTIAGIWILSEPVLVVNNMDNAMLGQCVLDALGGSRQQVPQPESWESLFNPVLKLAGVKSLTTFMKSAKCVEIELDGEQATVIPTRNLGVDDGFEPLQVKAMRSEVNPDKLGATILAALLQSQ